MLPRISVVTCSYNQGQFIGRTIDSVLAQDYPDVEHIVIDGMSADDTPEVLARYPHLRVVREPDGGQSEAINKGFRLATGDILCFLNSDDTLLPGALRRVAEEIDPSRGRHVVVGRCAFVDEHDVPSGVEHPSGFLDHERVLKVWDGHCIPQPATFWTRRVWEECGPLDEGDHLVLDYDLMCRISRRYRFHPVDQVLATYRLHTNSKSCSHAPEQVYDAATRSSRRYWGPVWKPRYWRLLCSLGLYRLERNYGRKKRASDYSAMGVQAWKGGARKRGLALLGRAALLAPEVALRRAYRVGVRAFLGRVWPGLRSEAPALTWRSGGLPLTTSAYRSFSDRHADGLVGPSYATTIDLEAGTRWARLEGTPILGVLPRPLNLEVAIDGEVVAKHQLETGRPFSLDLPVAGFGPGAHRVEVGADYFLLPDDFRGNGDIRPVVFRELGVRVGDAGTNIRGEAA